VLRAGALLGLCFSAHLPYRRVLALLFVVLRLLGCLGEEGVGGRGAGNVQRRLALLVGGAVVCRRHVVQPAAREGARDRVARHAMWRQVHAVFSHLSANDYATLGNNTIVVSGGHFSNMAVKMQKNAFLWPLLILLVKNKTVPCEDQLQVAVQKQSRCPFGRS